MGNTMGRMSANIAYNNRDTNGVLRVAILAVRSARETVNDLIRIISVMNDKEKLNQLPRYMRTEERLEIARQMADKYGANLQSSMEVKKTFWEQYIRDYDWKTFESGCPLGGIEATIRVCEEMEKGILREEITKSKDTQMDRDLIL